MTASCGSLWWAGVGAVVRRYHSPLPPALCITRAGSNDRRPMASAVTQASSQLTEAWSAAKAAVLELAESLSQVCSYDLI